MRVRVQNRRFVPALIHALIGTAVLYVGATTGLAAWRTAEAAPRPGPGALPSVVENVPSSVPTTAEYGPLGGISMVFAGTEVRDGLVGTVDHPWIAVSAHTGEYRAIDGPELPAAGASVMTISRDGNLLAWSTGTGVVVYDAVAGESRELEVDGLDHVGDFSPDSRLLLVHGDELGVLDVANGDVLATVEGDDAVMTRAAWRADSSAVDVVVGARLITLDVADDETSFQPTDIPEPAVLAWSSDGQQLASLREADGVKRLFISRLQPTGVVTDGAQIPTEGLALDRLLGFSGQRSIAVVAYPSESGGLERVMDIPLDARSPVDLTTLPPPGENWVGTDTLAVASDGLVAGSTDYPEQIWAWSYLARLVACGVFALFLLGLYVTRRPGASRR